MNALQFLKSLKAESVPPVILLVGEEGELHSMVIDRLVKLKLGENASMGLEHLEAGSKSMMQILDAAASGGLFAAERVIVVHNAESLSAPSGSPELKELQKYLADPDPSLTLIFSAPSVNKGKHPFKLLAKEAELVECTQLKGKPLQDWIVKYVRDRGYSFSGHSLQLAMELLGNDMLLIRNAMEKVMLFCGERKQIEYEDIEKSFGAMREHAIWELTSAIGARDTEKSTKILARLLYEGKHPLQIATSLQYQFKQLLTVKSLLLRKLSLPEIQKQAGIRFFAERIVANARSFAAPELLAAYDTLFHLEDSIKSAGIDARFLMEKCIIDICRIKN